MEVSDDEEDESLVKLNEDELRELQKVDSIQVIEGMRISPRMPPDLTFPCAEWCTCH
jgi:hypothetical protein